MNDFSDEHLLFLKKRQKEKNLVLLFRISIIFIFIFLWELLTKFKIINSFLLSSPTHVISTISELFIKGNLFNHLFITIFEVLISSLISFIIAFLISIIMWRYKFIFKIFDPYITVLNSLPKVALGPLIIIWAGSGINSIIFMSLLISCFVTIINIYNGFTSVNQEYILLLKTFNSNNRKIFNKVIFPASLINIINSLKINVSMNFIGLLPPVGENLFFNKYCSKY